MFLLTHFLYALVGTFSFLRARRIRLHYLMPRSGFLGKPNNSAQKRKLTEKSLAEPLFHQATPKSCRHRYVLLLCCALPVMSFISCKHAQALWSCACDLVELSTPIVNNFYCHLRLHRNLEICSWFSLRLLHLHSFVSCIRAHSKSERENRQLVLIAVIKEFEKFIGFGLETRK